jgi:CTP synthase (UTP-ammonia lyase)
MGEHVGQIEKTQGELLAPKQTLLVANIRKSVLVILAHIRFKPSKPDTKEKKAKTLKSELQQIRRLGVKEDEVLPKSIHDAAIKAIATGGAQ